MTDPDKRIASVDALRSALKQYGLVFAGIAAAWLTVVLVVGFFTRDGFTTVGQIGDAMAFLAMIAAALGLVVTAYGLILQRHDIGVQIAELSKTAEASRELAAKEGQAILLGKWEQAISACDALEREIIRDTDIARSALTHNEQLAVSIGNRDYGFIGPANARSAAVGWNKVWIGLSDSLPGTLDRISTQRDKALDAVSRADIQDEHELSVLLESVRGVRSGWRQDLHNLNANAFV